MGVRKGDAVTIYMPMVPEIAYTMLACARIGAPHSVVFAGFSSTALAARINNLQTKWVVTTDEGESDAQPRSHAAAHALVSHLMCRVCVCPSFPGLAPWLLGSSPSALASCSVRACGL